MGILLWGVLFCFGESRPLGVMPAGMIYGTPLGIVFPGPNVASGINAAALGHQKGKSIQAVFATPTTFGPTGQSAFASAAFCGKMLSVGGGYQAALNSFAGGQGFGGVGLKYDPIMVGVSLRAQGSVTWDSGFVFKVKDNLYLAGTLHGIGYSPALGLGVGLKLGRRYQIEGGVRIPSLMNFGNSLLLIAQGTFSAGILEVFLNGSFYTSSSYFNLLAGVAVWLGEHVALLTQYSNSQYLQLGLTIRID